MEACFLRIIWNVKDFPPLVGKHFLGWSPQLRLPRLQDFSFVIQSTEPNRQEEASSRESARGLGPTSEITKCDNVKEVWQMRCSPSSQVTSSHLLHLSAAGLHRQCFALTTNQGSAAHDSSGWFYCCILARFPSLNYSAAPY